MSDTATASKNDTANSRKKRTLRIIDQHHSACLMVFATIVVLHWIEHLTQAVQIYLLEWPRPEAGGVLGLFFPYLVTSELLHYGFASIMLIGLWLLRHGFSGSARQWWTLTLAIQFWHHFEHLLLLIQALSGSNLGGAPVPTSLVQYLVPRVELHLFYNAVVTIPMVVAMVLYYRRTPAGAVDDT